MSDTIHKLAHEMQIGKAVIFAGEQDNVSAWYQSMDIFVMPSVFGGVLLASIEAQASGVPCVSSQAIPCDAGFGKRVSFIDRDQSNLEWANTILASKNLQKSGQIIPSTYDIATAAIRLQDTYIKLLEGLPVKK